MTKRFGNPNGQAWFYHNATNTKEEIREPIGYPPISQIPGLSHTATAQEDVISRRYWIRESDSDYVRLAKQGGIPDLLSMNNSLSNETKKGPVGYPVCDWYYHNSTAPKIQEKLIENENISNQVGSPEDIDNKQDPIHVIPKSNNKCAGLPSGARSSSRRF